MVWEAGAEAADQPRETARVVRAETKTRLPSFAYSKHSSGKTMTTRGITRRRTSKVRVHGLEDGARNATAPALVTGQQTDQTGRRDGEKKAGATRAVTPSMPMPAKIRASSRLLLEGQTRDIFEAAGEDHDEINQRPDAAAAEGQQLCDADAGMPGIETMDTKTAQKETQQHGGQPFLVGDRSCLNRAGRCHRHTTLTDTPSFSFTSAPHAGQNAMEISFLYC